jgi:hypothetical protein
MNPILRSILLITFTASLYGCPYDSPYNLDETPLQNIDESLLGKWTTIRQRPAPEKHTKSEESVVVVFSKRTDMEYDVAITGNLQELRPYHVIINDSIKGTAYFSVVAGKQFLNAYIHGRVYLAQVIKDSSSLSIMPLAEYFTSKLIKNSKELRTAVEFHYIVRPAPGFDLRFCLKGLQKQE